MPVDQVAVEYYCPEFSEGFHVLESATFAGSFTLKDDPPNMYAPAIKVSGSSCSGSGGYSDIEEGTMRSTRCTGVLGSEQSSVASSPISQKFLDQLTTLASERNQRILDAKPRIPGLLWTGLLFGGVVLLGLGGFMRLGSVRAHLLLLSAVAVLLGLLLFIVFWLDHPFGNQLGVTSAPFEQSLSVFDSIDRGT